MYSRVLECRAEGGVDLGEMPKYTKYCTYIVYRLWYGYGVTNLIIFSKSKLPFYLMKQILSQIFLKKKTTTFSLQSTFLKVLSYLYTYVHFEQMFTWHTYVKGYELRKLDRLDCPATNCKNSTTTYTTTIAN